MLIIINIFSVKMQIILFSNYYISKGKRVMRRMEQNSNISFNYGLWFSILTSTYMINDVSFAIFYVGAHYCIYAGLIRWKVDTFLSLYNLQWLLG